MANIILVDDHEIIMDSLKYLIEGESKHRVVGKFKSGRLFMDHLSSNPNEADLAIVDVRLPDINGVDLTAIVTSKYPQLKIILLSQYSNQEFVLSGLKNGACGYIIKSVDGEELLLAIEKVLSGKQYLCEESTKVLIQSNKGANLNLQLTQREKDVLKLIAKGLTAKQIADELEIEASTVDYHKKNLKTKLNANKISDLTKCALELGIVDFKGI